MVDCLVTSVIMKAPYSEWNIFVIPNPNPNLGFWNNKLYALFRTNLQNNKMSGCEDCDNQLGTSCPQLFITVLTLKIHKDFETSNLLF